MMVFMLAAEMGFILTVGVGVIICCLLDLD